MPGPIPDSFLFDDSLIVPIFQTGKLRHGEAKLSNLSIVRLLVQGRSGVQAGAQGLEFLLADCAALRGYSRSGRRALTALFYRMAALLLGLRAEPQPEYRC